MRQKANGFKRLLAFLIDVIPLWLLSLVMYNIITGESPMAEDPRAAFSPGRILARDGCILWWILYSAIAECSPLRGTFGKKMMDIEVLGPHRRPLSFGRAVGRNFAKIISAVPLFIGFFWAFISKDSNAWHDSIAGCSVYERR